MPAMGGAGGALRLRVVEWIHGSEGAEPLHGSECTERSADAARGASREAATTLRNKEQSNIGGLFGLKCDGSSRYKVFVRQN